MELLICKVAEVLQPATLQKIAFFHRRKSVTDFGGANFKHLAVVLFGKKNFFSKNNNKRCDLVHISNIDVWDLMPVRLYAGPSFKFCLLVFTNFSSCSESFSTFVIVNSKYDEHLTWIKFHVDLISRSA